jgi:hypothetical protein
METNEFEIYKDQKLEDLKRDAKLRGIKNFSKMKKADLITAIANYSEDPTCYNSPSKRRSTKKSSKKVEQYNTTTSLDLEDIFKKMTKPQLIDHATKLNIDNAGKYTKSVLIEKICNGIIFDYFHDSKI